MALRRPRSPEVKPPPLNAAEIQKALTAATVTVPLLNDGAWATWRYGNRDWQIEAWRLYDIVPELRFMAGWIGDSVSQARLYVTRINENGEPEGEVEDNAIARLGALPLGSGSERDDNLRLLGIDLAVAGEAWIVGEGGATDDPTGWFVLSSGQIRREGGEIIVRRPLQIGGGVLHLRDGNDLLIRAWRPHPNDIFQSDSPTRPAIPALREIELVTKREFAELESRLTGAGVWFLPEGIDFPRSEGDPEGVQGFMAYMQKIAALNIREQSQASAMVPIMTTIPDHMIEHMDKFKPVNFWSELSDKLSELKEKAIGRVAAAFEIPSGLLGDGMGEANHWTAWAIGEEGIKRIKPYLATIADTLTRGFLIPALERNGVPDADTYAYAFDVAPLAVRPNRLDEALQLWDRFLISDEEAVRSGAFGAEQMPGEDERIKMLLFRAVTQDPSLLTDPGIRAAIGIGGAPIAIQSSPPPALPSSEPTTPGPPTNLNDGPSTETPGPGDSAVIASLMQQTLDMQARLAVCDMIVLRAMEMAGGKLATPAERIGKWKDTPRHELHTRVGPVTPDKADKVLQGSWNYLARAAQQLSVDQGQLETLLHEYCRELLTRGIAHHEDLLSGALRRLRRD